MLKILNEMKDMVFILLVTGVFSWVANLINIHPDLGGSAIGVFLLVVLASLGIFISKLPGFHKLPMVFWVSIVAVVVSIPGFPGGDVVLSYTKQVSFLALTTPLLAYAGLSVGKDMEAFKALSWRIIPVALAVAAGSFICATILAEIMLGHVDVLVCNAGIAQQKLFTDITPAEWQHMLDVNLTGAFHLCQLALPEMIRRKWGRILTVSSMWGQTGGSCEVHYSAAKAGLIGLTKALAREEGPSGITVNCVAPGVIDTDMMAAFTPGDKAALAEETPVGRLGNAQEVARALLFLAGEEAGYITGQVFGVNGGLVI